MTDIQANLITASNFSVYDAGQSGNVSGFASSNNGRKMYASIYGSTNIVLKSTDEGVNWTAITGVGSWSSVACSADGKIVYATWLGQGLYKSINSGATWSFIVQYPQGLPGGASNPENSAPFNDYNFGNVDQVACDGTGTKLIMTTNAAASIYTSSNGGATWTFKYVIPNYKSNPQSAVPVASNNDGSVLYYSATQTDHNIYRSTDGGSTWAQITSQGTIDGPFPYIASNLTGDIIFAVNVNFNIFYESYAANGVVPATNGSNVTVCGSYVNGNKAMIMVNNYNDQTGGFVETYSIDNIYPPGPIPGPLTCFKENTKILCLINGVEQYVLVQELKKGILVKTFKNEYKKIEIIGEAEMQHTINKDRIKDQLYKLSSENYPSIFEDLILTGCHSVLISEFKDGEKEKTIEILGRIFITDGYYRLPACANKNAIQYEKEGIYKIYHIALENDNIYTNYGIYANGLLVESCSKRFLKEYSGMNLIE